VFSNGKSIMAAAKWKLIIHTATAAMTVAAIVTRPNRIKGQLATAATNQSNNYDVTD
jgi:hypothetical protein